MGKRGKASKSSKPGQSFNDAVSTSTAAVDRGALAQCLSATSQIAAECNSILRDLLRGRYVVCFSFATHVIENFSLFAAIGCVCILIATLIPCYSYRSPQQQDLQRLASQVLVGQTLNLQELQKKMESQQATLAELLKVLKPNAGSLDQHGVGDGTYSLPLPEPSLSVIKGWDSFRDTHYSGAGRTTIKRRPQKGQNNPRHDTMNKRDRYISVEGYWRTLKPEDRRKLLKSPVAKLVEGN